MKETHFSNLLHTTLIVKKLYINKTIIHLIFRNITEIRGSEKRLQSLTIIPQFLNLLVVPEIKKKIQSFLQFYTHWFQSTLHLYFLNFKMLYFITYLTLFSECRCNGLLTHISFTYHFFWGKDQSRYAYTSVSINRIKHLLSKITLLTRQLLKNILQTISPTPIHSNAL